MGPGTMELMEECLLQDARGLTTGECALKRLAPRPVVSLRLLAMESTSRRREGPQQIRVFGPELNRGSAGCIQPEHLRTTRQAGRGLALPSPSHVRSARAHDAHAATTSPLPQCTGNSSPYFSSSLTLSIRGAVSPARHVLTRPRPHPVLRAGVERIAGPVRRQGAP